MIEFRTSKKEQRQSNSENGKSIVRKDWGYTNYYRRMMQQRLSSKNEKEEETH